MQKTIPNVMQNLCRQCEKNNTTVWKEAKEDVKEIFKKAVTKVQNTYNEMKTTSYKPRGFRI